MGKMLTKVKGIKGMPLLAIGLAMGLLLIAAGNIGFGGSGKATETAAPQSKDAEDLEEYRKELEKQLKELIEKLDGASNVSVMLTFEQGSCLEYAQDGTYNGGIATSKKYVLNDKDEPIAVKTICPKIRGVAVVCSGGSNPILAQKIINLLCALLDVNSSRVYVSG